MTREDNLLVAQYRAESAAKTEMYKEITSLVKVVKQSVTFFVKEYKEQV